MTAPQFFTKEWADTVRDALTAGPDAQARSGKLQEYWDFFDWLKSQYPSSWALGCRDLGSYLFVQWGDGQVADARIVGAVDFAVPRHGSEILLIPAT